MTDPRIFYGVVGSYFSVLPSLFPHFLISKTLQRCLHTHTGTHAEVRWAHRSVAMPWIKKFYLRVMSLWTHVILVVIEAISCFLVSFLYVVCARHFHVSSLKNPSQQITRCYINKTLTHWTEKCLFQTCPIR